ncbi:MAG: hypothetical protein HY899_09590 [Deltaproteobacteria bacterium]|nr:hypothetical protein [Deltaproteobacteria bacterium]
MRWGHGYVTTARAALLGAVLAGYVLGLALASSPQLHDFFHHDAEQSQHVCLATTLHAGQSEPVLGVVDAVEPVATPIAKFPPCEAGNTGSFFLRCRLLRHGPPDLLPS